MAVNIPGIVAVAVFYLAILVVGIITGWKTNKSTSNESVLVADRSLGLVVATFTVTATMVGGGYINGSSESAYTSGVIQTQAPLGYCLALLIASLTYVPKMRIAGYITMFDPFQLKYGLKVGAILFIPELLGDLFWCAATLSALGDTISIILDMDATLAIIISATVAVVYTFLGGLYSVAYTDVIQLGFIAVGLILAFPFALTNSAVDLNKLTDTWVGNIPTDTIGSYIDVGLLCTFGGIPWQTLFQRVLACRTVRVAKVSTLVAAFFSLLMAGPAIAMGLAGKGTDWNATSFQVDGPVLPEDKERLVLPLTLHYLTPLVVSIIGIGALSAAVMSSADSCILSASSVFSKNIYAELIRPGCSERELMWVLRVSVLVVGVLSTLIAVFSDTIYGLYVLCSDLMYVVLFPQLTFVLWMSKSNAYGCLVGFFVSFLLRLLSGERVIGLPATIKYPMYDEATHAQLFPHRTFAMLVGSLCLVVVSLVTHKLFVNNIAWRKYDVLKCYKQRSALRRCTVEDFNVPDHAAQVVPLREKQRNVDI